MRTFTALGGALALWIAGQRTALAGMPSFGFTDAAQLRLQTISFFLVGLLASALVVRWLWNALAKDLTRLPRLGYPAAVGVVVLWGLLFIIVLTMISGARELMTPGAWEKKGVTYQLRPAESPEQRDRRQAERLVERRSHLEQLALELTRFAAAHDGTYPRADEVDQIPEYFWRPGNPPELRYVYIPGRTANDKDQILAYEPQRADECFVLLSNGELEQLPFDVLIRLLPSEAAR